MAMVIAAAVLPPSSSEPTDDAARRTLTEWSLLCVMLVGVVSMAAWRELVVAARSPAL